MPEGEGEGEAGALGQQQDAVVAAEPLLIAPFLTRFGRILKLYCLIDLRYPKFDV